MLAGQQPAPIKLDFIQWIMRLLPLIPFLQIAGVFATLRLIRRWRVDLKHRPSHARTWIEYILLPLIPNLSLAAILVYLQSSRLLRFLHLYMPDLSWVIRISGVFAAIWTFLRTGLILQTLRQPEPSNGSKRVV